MSNIKLIINWNGPGNYAFTAGSPRYEARIGKASGVLFSEYCASLRDLRVRFAGELGRHNVEVMNWTVLR